MFKRIYFFKDSSYFEYDPRPGIDRIVKGPIAIGAKFRGLNVAFAAGINAAVNWGDGFVYFFKGDEYWKYDVLSDLAATATPTKIAAGWPTFPDAFKGGIDTTFNGGEGKAYFFKGDEYLRYSVANDRVDDPDPGTAPYPRKIADPNGWRGLPVSFNTGLDAAVNAGDGKLYFFKGDEYVRLTFATRSVDQVQPPYPLRITAAWNGLPIDLGEGIEWSEAGSAQLDIQIFPTCQKVAGPNLGSSSLGRAFSMLADFALIGYPTLCGCAEYRQFVRGTIHVNGAPFPMKLPNPAGVPDIDMLPRPAPGALDDNFREDGNSGVVKFYGHRADTPDPKGIYSNPDQRSGCTYRGIDSPLFSGLVGQVVEIDLDFRGVIIDVCAGNEVLVTKEWNIFCTDTL
jgi:Hemopexin